MASAKSLILAIDTIVSCYALTATKAPVETIMVPAALFITFDAFDDLNTPLAFTARKA